MLVWKDKEPTISIEPPRNPKKLTGTRFASVLGLNPWSTPFEMWCAITRTYEEPFVENKYTIAGTAIEPIIIEYLRDVYFGRDNIIDPTQIYGQDPFKETWGNFFPDEPIFGGMWDAILLDDTTGEEIAIIEIKTTSRIDKWEDGAPDYQALQGALYAHLKGLDTVIMVVAVLEEEDYFKPQAFRPTVSNVIIDEFNIYERYPDFDEKIAYAEEWWEHYVLSGNSPFYDKRKDAEILQALKTNFVDTRAELTEMANEAAVLHKELEEAKAQMKKKADRLKKLEATIKDSLIDNLRPNDTKAVVETDIDVYYELTLSERTSIDKEAMERDGILDDYSVTTTSYTLRTKRRKD